MTHDDASNDPRSEPITEQVDPTSFDSLSHALVRAVSDAAGTPPTELPPLNDSVDLDALEALFEPLSEDVPRDHGRVRFAIDGRTVTVEATGDITVHDPGTGRDGHNVLLVAPDRTPTDDDACIELLEGPGSDRRNVLSITFDQTAEDRLEIWRERSGRVPATAAIVDVGETVRSAAGRTVTPGEGLTITAVADASDIAALGTTITEHLGARADDGTQTTLCFHSLHGLLQHVDAELAFEFLHLLTGQIRKHDATAHYHLDRSAIDEGTFRFLAVLFDRVIDRTDTGDARSRS